MFSMYFDQKSAENNSRGGEGEFMKILLRDSRGEGRVFSPLAGTLSADGREGICDVGDGVQNYIAGPITQQHWGLPSL